MPTKEIITLQLGHYANFVGTHWWNIQESSFEYGNSENQKGDEIDHDVLFREGFTDRGHVTFTPRLVLAELKGGLGNLRQEGSLYDCDVDVDYSVAWDGKTSVHKQSETTKNEFLKDLDNPNPHGKDTACNRKPLQRYHLEDGVRVWSDYLRTFLHPKSTVIVNDYHHESSSNPFDFWAKGTSLNGIVEEMEERVRFYAEECDLLQGFHIICDSDNGFTGLSSSFMPYLQDEFPSKALVSFPVHPAKFADDNRSKLNLRNLNSALLLPALTESCSLVLPLSLQPDNKQDKLFPGLVYDVNLNYHTSAILAAAMDTFTLSHRLKGMSCSDLDEFRIELTAGARNLISTSLMMPVPIQQLHQSGLFMLPLETTTITPNLCHEPQTITECLSNCITLRGADLCDSPNQFFNGKHNYLADLDDLIQQHLITYFPGARTSYNVLKSPMKTAAPFPTLFLADQSGCRVQKIYHNGNRLLSPHLNGYDTVNGTTNHTHTNGHTVPPSRTSVPMLTSLSCTSKAAGVFDAAAKALHTTRAKLGYCGLEKDDLEPRIEYLLSMRDDYKPNTSSCFSSDEDTAD